MSEQPGKSNWLIYLLAFLGLAALAGGGVIFYQSLPASAPPEGARNAFDLDKVPEDKPAGAPSAPQAARSLLPENQTNLTPIPLGAGDKGFVDSGAQPPKKTLAVSEETRRKTEDKISQLAWAYSRKYPIVVRYGREWMSYPDLRKLTNDYMSDRDPVKFMQGLAQSKNFPLLVKKYAGTPEIQAFVTDALKQAPGEAIGAVAGFFKDEKAVKGVVSSVLSGLGLPSGLLDSAENGKVDQAAIVNSLTKGNPQLQQLMQDPNAKKAIQNSSR